MVFPYVHGHPAQVLAGGDDTDVGLQSAEQYRVTAVYENSKNVKFCAKHSFPK
jgi:hypothetical protein